MMSPHPWPSVSVIIPAYNQAHFLPRCLDSVAAQRYEGTLEVLVIDDGSVDASAEVARRHPIGARVLSQDNGGVARARNAGIDASTGEYVAFLDADDTWLEGKLHAQIALVQERAPVSLSLTRYQRVDTHGVAFKAHGIHPAPQVELTARRLMRQNFVGTSTAIVHRECLRVCGGFPTDREVLGTCEDYVLWLKIALRFPLVYLDRVHTAYTVHESNRVGVDPLAHHIGGLRALRAVWAWDGEAARSAARGAPLEAILLYRSAKLIKDLILRHRHVPPDVWPRLLPALAELFDGPNTPDDESR